MKRILSISLCCIGALTMMGGCGNNAAKKAAEDEAKQAEEAAIEAARKEQAAIEQLAKLPDEPVFDLNTNLGTIKVKLYSKTPKHRENFAKLALTGYFDGMLFHRVINGFMIQGGDPLSKDPENKSKFGTPAFGFAADGQSDVLSLRLAQKTGVLSGTLRLGYAAEGGTDVAFVRSSQLYGVLMPHFDGLVGAGFSPVVSRELDPDTGKPVDVATPVSFRLEPLP